MSIELEVKTTRVEVVPPPKIDKQQLKKNKAARRALIVKEKSKKYKFDLTLLENDMDTAYKEFRKDETEATRTVLFECIRELSFAILVVGNLPKTKLDNDQTAYEYSLYLFERLVTGALVPEFKDRMPWQKYIDLNLKHIVHKTLEEDTSWIELVEDMEFLIERFGYSELVNPHEESMKAMEKDKLSRKLFNALTIFYTFEDMKRLMPISIELIHANPKYMVNDKMPPDVKDFATVLISISKKIISFENIHSKKQVSKSELGRMFTSATRSTVFLSAVVDSDFFPKELILALDIDSLYRLVQVSGGQKIRIPTQRELDTLVGAVVTASKVILDGTDKKDSLNEAKRDMDLVFSHQVNIQNFVTKVIDTITQFGPDPDTPPIIRMLSVSMDSMKKLFANLLENYKRDPEYVDPDYLAEFQECLHQSIDNLKEISASLDATISTDN